MDKEFTITTKLDVVSTMRNVEGDLFILSNKKGSYALHRGEEELAFGSNMNCWDVGDYYVAGSYQKKKGNMELGPQLVLDRNGGIAARTFEGEYILLAGDGYLVTRRGNYIFLSDWKGRCGFYALSCETADD